MFQIMTDPAGINLALCMWITDEDVLLVLVATSVRPELKPKRSPVTFVSMTPAKHLPPHALLSIAQEAVRGTQPEISVLSVCSVSLCSTPKVVRN